MAIHSAAPITALAMQSLLPRIHGAWHMVTTGHLELAGLVDNVPDQRLNSCRVYMNRVSRNFRSNMNYRVEHDMAPKVLYRVRSPHLPAPRAAGGALLPQGRYLTTR